MKERDEKRPGGSLQQPSVTSAPPGTRSNLSLERNVRSGRRKASQNKAGLQVAAPGPSCHQHVPSAPAAASFRPCRPFQNASLFPIRWRFLLLWSEDSGHVRLCQAAERKRGPAQLQPTSSQVCSSDGNTAARTSARASTQEAGWR